MNRSVIYYMGLTPIYLESPTTYDLIQYKNNKSQIIIK